MIAYGKRVFWHIVEHHSDLIEEVYLGKEIDKKEFSEIAKLNKKIIKVDPKKAQAMSHGGAHQGYLLNLQGWQSADFSGIKKQDFLVVTVGVTDMGNLGSIARSAHALGATGLIISGIKQVNWEALIKPSAGALFDIPICHYDNPFDMMHELSQYGFTLFGATSKGDSIRQVKREGKTALLLGAEGEGLNPKVIKKLDRQIGIPMQHGFDSLNVAIAAAILIDRMSE